MQSTRISTRPTRTWLPAPKACEKSGIAPKVDERMSISWLKLAYMLPMPAAPTSTAPFGRWPTAASRKSRGEKEVTFEIVCGQPRWKICAASAAAAAAAPATPSSAAVAVASKSAAMPLICSTERWTASPAPERSRRDSARPSARPSTRAPSTLCCDCSSASVRACLLFSSAIRRRARAPLGSRADGRYSLRRRVAVRALATAAAVSLK
mmetsp:Transcript_60846/g.181148  ORF Transcript_60846/g.181148 Transcript_60846/m.181148 type:complete len:209 (-) Transcript_60846:273-899(-)